MCAVLGLAALLCGLRIPVYLRAVDSGIIEQAGRASHTLVDNGLTLVQENKLGAAQLVASAARQQRLPGQEKLADAVARLTRGHPGWQSWGAGDTRVESLFGSDAAATNPAVVPLTDFMVSEEHRTPVLTEWLGASQRPLVQELLRFRSSTNTAIFSPSDSSAGSVLDTAICVCGLLVERGDLTTGLNDKMLAAAAAANAGANSQPLEQALLDMMSLGQRFNWGQMVTFIRRIDSLADLRVAASAVRNNEDRLPVVFSAVQLSGEPGAVGRYLQNFSQSGVDDLGWSLRYGAAGVNELLHRNQRVHHSATLALPDWLLQLAWRAPLPALALKWLLYAGSGFLLALALHFARPPVSALERPLQVRGFHYAREILFALGFLVVILLVSEPFLAQESQKKTEITLRLQLPSISSVAPGKATDGSSKFMNAKSLLTLLLFFVLQALLYSASLVKLAEVRRQKVPSRVKLKLLENEEHLFDAGLYLGFAGTIVSLILVSLGVMQPSLMAAYGSTSFGIIFVSIFKIFHLRPLRRKFLLEAESTPEQPVNVPAGSPVAAQL